MTRTRVSGAVTATLTTDGVATRDRMIRSAIELIRQRGVTRTGLRDVALHARAPRGSLQHYFPAGKEQLVGEALALAGQIAASRVSRRLQDGTFRRPSDLLVAVVDEWREALSTSGYASGCPLVAAASDVAADDTELRAVIKEAFDRWLRSITSGLEQLRVPAERSEKLATLMISALEGAIVLSRTHENSAPLDGVIAELGPLLDAASSTHGSKGRRPLRGATNVGPSET